MFYACISPKRCSALNTCGNDFIHRYIERVTSHKRKKLLQESLWGVTGGVAGEGCVVGVPKFHFWEKCIMPLTNINSDWMSNASSGLCIIILSGSFISHLSKVVSLLRSEGTNQSLWPNICLQIRAKSDVTMTCQFFTCKQCRHSGRHAGTSQV